MKIVIPPLKSQGIKTKLVNWINDLILQSGININSNWIEPFFGTGVVGFNSPLTGKFVVGDTNPHTIKFYKEIQKKIITPYLMRKFLERENILLSNSEEDGYVHFREVRKRFNKDHDSYDYIFLSRAGFNGMMRFNSKGEWNVPFCKKSNRFSPAYITKICNQIELVSKIIQKKDWQFNNDSFYETILKAQEGDIIYCDPPYLGRYVDYYNGWEEKDEELLCKVLSETKAKFILSTWHHNDFRKNEMIDKYWSKYNIVTSNHFYHNGGKLENRHSMVEALIFNFDLKDKLIIDVKEPKQLSLF